ncbi:MAG: hypothetical protein NC033_05035 [Clostridiales bacterium]|nr:hypothetical protein [Clostridiales bacterium]
MKREILLNHKQLNLLLKIIGSKTIQYEVLETKIIIDESNMEKLTDLISNYYTKFGINHKYEPNKLGDEIEILLDKFI